MSACRSPQMDDRWHELRSRRRVIDFGMSLGCVLLVLSGCFPSQNSTTAPATDKNSPLETFVEKGPVKLAVRISPREPRLSDIVEMEVEVTAKDGVEIIPPAFGSAVGDFLIRNYSERKPGSPGGAEDQIAVRKFSYQLEPVQAGRHLIRSVQIEFVDRRPDSESKGEPAYIETEPIEIKVTSELGDHIPNLGDLEPMAPPKPLKPSVSWNLWLVGLATAVALALVLWKWKKRRASATPPYVKSPEEIAHEALTKLLSEDLPARGLFKDFYLRLTGIVRNYIEGTTGLKAPEQTTEEFLRAIRARDIFPAEKSVRLIEFLEAADMVKYAGQQPSSDQVELSIARAREFVEMPSGPSTKIPEAAEA